MFSLFRKKKKSIALSPEGEVLSRRLQELVLAELPQDLPEAEAERCGNVCRETVAYAIDEAMDRWIEENAFGLTEKGCDGPEITKTGLHAVTSRLADGQMDALTTKALARLGKG